MWQKRAPYTHTPRYQALSTESRIFRSFDLFFCSTLDSAVGKGSARQNALNGTTAGLSEAKGGLASLSHVGA
jgi:hypothetical protein